MEKVIIVRFAEIYLKGKNRIFFENLLKNNLKNAVFNYNATVTRIPGRFLINGFDLSNLARVTAAIDKVAGVFSYSVATQIETSYANIKKLAIAEMQNKIGTFKVQVNRADKTFEYNSMQLASILGGDILENCPNLKVDVHNPENTLNVDIRENGRTYIFSKSILGVGGMPVGSSGKGLLLLSGGIDSPVASYMMSKRGTKIVGLHFHSYPYTSPLARQKVENLTQILAPYNAGDMTIYMVNMANYQEAINSNCDVSYMITLLRRGMFRIAERLAKEQGLDMIITGENLGQVASQTIESMTVVENVVESTPILRPLIAFDKNEIISVARKIGTFETSVQPYEDCCTVFLPDNPVTKPRITTAKKQENKFDADDLLEKAYSTMEVVKIKAQN